MKTIYLKSNGLGRYEDVSPFVMTDNTLKVKVELPEYNGQFFLVAENNGNKFKQLIEQGGKITINGLTAGELQVKIEHYLKGEPIRTYKVEPLILKELDVGLQGVPEIEELNGRTENLKKSIDEIEKNNLIFSETLSKLKMQFFALMRFAMKDYKNNVYLDGGSEEEFIKEFGFDLTDEEIKEIIGGQDNE